MQLLTKALRRSLPSFGDGESEPFARVKFFTPDANWTWYAAEFDGDDTFYGLVDGFELEFGYFSLSELESVRGTLGLPVERDLHFTAIPLMKLYEELQAQRRA